MIAMSERKLSRGELRGRFHPVQREVSVERNDVHRISVWWMYVSLTVGILLYATVYFNFIALPDGLQRSDEIKYPDRFIAERAQEQLIALADIGPKVAGSDENEIIAVNLLLEEIRKIKDASVHRVEYQVQKTSGSFFLNTQPYGMSTVYQNVQNIIVRLSSAAVNSSISNAHSLLINSHFDTVPVSSGGGDAGSMCAVMLEILRVLSKSVIGQKHAIIFLFNGAEENLLQASHGFITQHEWANTVRAFINLDAAGNGGKEVMFQAGPKHPWLMKYYRSSAVHPWASAMGEELFQANLIPSDTDFRIFRDFAGLPGMDFAYNSNGYVYHTKYDTHDIVPRGTLQHTGDNILALTKALANAPELENVSAHADGKVVFFDFLGWFMIFYTELVGIVVNSVTAVAAIAIIILSIRSMSLSRAFSFGAALREFAIVFCAQLAAIGLAVAFPIVMAILNDTANRSMSWFSNAWLIFGLYFCPAMCGLAVGPILFTTRQRKTTISLSHQVQLFLHAQCILYVIALIVLTAAGIRSAFVILIAVLFYVISAGINLFSSFQNKPNLWLYVHIAGQIVPFLFYAHLSMLAFVTFLPLAGRSGPSSNPDIMISVFSIAMGIFLTGFLMPLFCLCRKPVRVVYGFVTIILLSIIVMMTPLGFPYREATSPQRYWIFHTSRRVHYEKYSTSTNDTGYFMLAMDRHSPYYAQGNVPKIGEAISLEADCGNKLFCGVPLYTARMHAQTNHSHWIQAGAPFLNTPAQLTLASAVTVAPRTKRYHFKVSGPDHMGIFLSPNKDATVVRWSITHKMPRSGPLWQSRDTHFVYLSSSKENNEFDFTFELKVDARNPELRSDVFFIALTAHYMHYDNERTDEFKSFIESFPKWSHVTAWMSSYEGWEYY